MFSIFSDESVGDSRMIGVMRSRLRCNNASVEGVDTGPGEKNGEGILNGVAGAFSCNEEFATMRGTERVAG